MNSRSIGLVFLVAFGLTMLGVAFFFKPIADTDTARLTLPPVVGLSYVVLCTVIYVWGFRETGHAYKAAAIVVAPQAALVIDLALRGDRGPVTAAAGIALLLVTWLGAAFVHGFAERRAAKQGNAAR
ncbi:MAG: hypothetical protein AAGE01_20060 [Pseudomonadota bacterium]